MASIVKAQALADGFPIIEADQTSYTPQHGEQVELMGLGGNLATVMEPCGDDEIILVHYGKLSSFV